MNETENSNLTHLYCLNGNNLFALPLRSRIIKQLGWNNNSKIQIVVENYKGAKILKAAAVRLNIETIKGDDKK